MRCRWRTFPFSSGFRGCGTRFPGQSQVKSSRWDVAIVFVKGINHHFFGERDSLSPFPEANAMTVWCICWLSGGRGQFSLQIFFLFAFAHPVKCVPMSLFFASICIDRSPLFVPRRQPRAAALKNHVNRGILEGVAVAKCAEFLAVQHRKWGPDNV